ncbi:unnamed protein product, partial [Prorocentrum cordatum]
HESGSVRARLPQPPQALRRPRRASEGNSARARVRARPSCGVVGGAARGTLGGAPARGAVRRRAAQSQRGRESAGEEAGPLPPSARASGPAEMPRTKSTARGRAQTPRRGRSQDEVCTRARISVRLRLQPHPSFGCASHLQGTRESRNRWARPPSAGRRAASRRVEKAITKNPAPSAATTKSARSTCLCTVGNSQLQHTCAPQGAGIVSNPTAPGAMLPQRRAQRC